MDHMANGDVVAFELNGFIGQIMISETSLIQAPWKIKNRGKNMVKIGAQRTNQ
jgi:hypothetical protein